VNLTWGVYASRSRDPDPAVRAGALSRLARFHLAAGNVAAALLDCRELAGLTTVAFDGMPADLFARRQISALMEQTGDRVALTREADALRTELLAGRWVPAAETGLPCGSMVQRQ
jgi:hypothetical protein